MPASQGLQTSLNEIRNTLIDNNTLYHQELVEVLPTTDIGSFAAPLFAHPELMNAFINVLVQRIAYTQIDLKMFNNKLKVLEGVNLPLGSIGQEIHINPAKGRKFDINDFAGLLARYEADVKVQYHHLNSDIQYPVTITRKKLKDAFVTWGDLEDFVNGMTQSLYNGAYIDRYNMTKGLVASAYASYNVVVEVIDEVEDETTAKAFLTKAREIFLNMQEPTSKYNAWRQAGGYGKDVLTWSNKEDIVLLIRNDIGAYLDVNVLAQAFNVDKASLLGNVIYVNDFDEYDSEGNKVFDGSKIYGMIADKNWFRIKNQEFSTDEFYNANNKTWQVYLNDTNMYSYSLFANAVVFAEEKPTVTITGLEVDKKSVKIKEEEDIEITVSTTPAQATTPVIEVESSTPAVATAEIEGKTITITGVSEGIAIIVVSAGNVTTEITVTVEAES